jgi:hypothetical protein
VGWLPLGRLNLDAVVERCIESSSALRRQIQNIPNWIQLIDAALSDVIGQPWMIAGKVAQRAVALSSEDRNRRVLLLAQASRHGLRCAINQEGTATRLVSISL